LSRKKYEISEIDTRRIGGRVLKIRLTCGLTQPQMAAKLGISHSNLSDVENGRYEPSFRLLQAILQNFPEFHAKWLLTGEGPMRGPFVRDYELVTRIEGPEESPEKGQEFFEVVADLPKGQAVTVVTKEEMALLHQLLTVLRTGDEDIKSAIKGNLLMAVRLCRFLNPRFGDIIILDRRVEQLPREAWPEGRSEDERKASTGRKGGA